MRIIPRLQEKLKFLCPDCTWTIDSQGINPYTHWVDDYDRIQNWEGPDPQPTAEVLEAITDEQYQEYVLDKEADAELNSVDKKFLTLVIWIANKTNTPLVTMKQQLKTIYRSL